MFGSIYIKANILLAVLLTRLVMSLIQMRKHQYTEAQQAKILRQTLAVSFKLCLMFNPFIHQKVKSDISRKKRKGPAIIVANHHSHLDPYILCSALLPYFEISNVKVVFTKYVENWPVVGAIAKKLQFIPIEFKSMDLFKTNTTEETATAAKQAIEDALSAGETIFAFPEAGRFPEARLGQLKSFLFKLASQKQIPVYAVSLAGTGLINPIKDHFDANQKDGQMHPGSVYIKVNKPIIEQDADKLKKLVFEQLSSYQTGGKALLFSQDQETKSNEHLKLS